MDTGGPNDDPLPTILGICEDFFLVTSPAVHRELDTLLRARDITGGPGWLIGMLAFTRLRLQAPAAAESQTPEVDEGAVRTRGD